MRPACCLPCSKLFYLGAAFMVHTVSAGILRICTRAFAPIALVLCIKLGATAQSNSPATPNAPAKLAPIGPSREDSNERIKSLMRKMTLAEKIGQLQQA